MSLSKPKKIKIDLEKRQFQSEWMDKYLFVLPAAMSNKLVCLLCNEYICHERIQREEALQVKSRPFSASFPEGSAERRGKVQRLLASFQRCQVALGRFCTEQERYDRIPSCSLDTCQTEEFFYRSEDS